MKEEEELVVDTTDYRRKRIVFTRKKWREKSLTHPDLLKKIFLKNLRETIENPEQVWQDYSDKKNKNCYYKKYSGTSYAKVVIWVGNNPCHVVTAFQIDYIKETIYPKLRRLK